MRLSEMRGRQGQSQYAQQYEEHPSSQQQQAGWAMDTYQRPIGALLNGRPVKLLATGNIPGLSPAQQFVDEDGKIDWASNDDFVVTDDNVFPGSIEQRNRLLSSANTTGSSSRR